MGDITDITIKVTMLGVREWRASSDYDGVPPVCGFGPTAQQAVEAWIVAFSDREISKAIADGAVRATARRAAARKSAATRARTRDAIGPSLCPDCGRSSAECWCA